MTAVPVRHRHGHRIHSHPSSASTGIYSLPEVAPVEHEHGQGSHSGHEHHDQTTPTRARTLPRPCRPIDRPLTSRNPSRCIEPPRPRHNRRAPARDLRALRISRASRRPDPQLRRRPHRDPPRRRVLLRCGRADGGRARRRARDPDQRLRRPRRDNHAAHPPAQLTHLLAAREGRSHRLRRKRDRRPGQSASRPSARESSDHCGW